MFKKSLIFLGVPFAGSEASSSGTASTCLGSCSKPLSSETEAKFPPTSFIHCNYHYPDRIPISFQFFIEIIFNISLVYKMETSKNLLIRLKIKTQQLRVLLGVGYLGFF